VSGRAPERPPALDVLIPTCGRPGPLAVLLASLAGQTRRDFRVVVSDQTEQGDPLRSPEVVAVVRVLRVHGHRVELHRHLPRRGMAEHRQFLLDHVRARRCLFLDDDLLLEPDIVERLMATIDEQGCGFAGCGLIGLSYLDDVRPVEQAIEFWDGPVEPEAIRPGTPEWARHALHNAANLHHLAQRLGPAPGERWPYKVAWVGGCVLYDAQALREAGGFRFWRDLPAEHAGEDVLAQLRVMARRGGCGVFPSGAYHQELPTTIPNRPVDAPRALSLDPGERRVVA
jgi:GT2 family glycosyltransferase